MHQQETDHSAVVNGTNSNMSFGQQQDHPPKIHMPLYVYTTLLKLLALTFTYRGVMIPTSVLENVSDSTKNAGIRIDRYTSLCTDLIPCDLLAAKKYQATSQLA